MPSKEERYKQQLRYREYLKKSWKFGESKRIAKGAYVDRKRPRRICPRCGAPMKKIDDYIETEDATTKQPLGYRRVVEIARCPHCGFEVEMFKK